MSGLVGRQLACVRGGRLVFEGLDFAVEPGQALLLRGPNGVGKSSLLRLMAGFLPPAAGAIIWDGNPITKDPDGHRARTLYTGHLDALKLALTGRENLAFWARIGGHGAARVTNALARLGISHLADIPAQLMSAGQRKRLNLARLVAAPASLWLMDEPATSLDADGAALVGEIMAAHLDSGGIVIAATHQDMLGQRATELRLTPANEYGDAA